jgi:hypothetical protein
VKEIRWLNGQVYRENMLRNASIEKGNLIGQKVVTYASYGICTPQSSLKACKDK